MAVFDAKIGSDINNNANREKRKNLFLIIKTPLFVYLSKAVVFISL
jgi:hypothetical protein